MSISQAEVHLKKGRSKGVQQRPTAGVGMYWLLASIAESLISVAKAQEKRNELLEEVNALSERQEERLEKLAEIQFGLYRKIQELEGDDSESAAATAEV